METTVQRVTLKLVSGYDRDYWKDVAGLHGEVALPKDFVCQIGEEEFMVTTVEGKAGGNWDGHKYHRIVVINLTKKVPIKGEWQLTVDMELPVVKPPKKYHTVEIPGTYEVKIGSGGAYCGETLVLVDGQRDQRWFRSKGVPCKGLVVGTGEEVIITSSNQEMRGGHGEGNYSISKLHITSLTTMNPLSDETHLMVEGTLCTKEEIIEV